jgi:hypothetical protein
MAMDKDMDMDIFMDIHEKSVDMDVEYHRLKSRLKSTKELARLFLWTLFDCA